MLVLDTFSHETIWGGEKLLPYSNSDVKRIGHLYSLCNEKGMESHILNGEYQGRPFQTFFSDHKADYGLLGYAEFPLILALVEAKTNLSIQVHPDDDMAIREERAQYGKNESWYFIEAPESGFLYNGCTTANKREVWEKLTTGRMLDVVGKLPVQAGDYVYVKAGTLHAITAGSFLYEIEENSPWTYRLYDYDRTDAMGNRRELHTEKGLQALDITLQSKSAPMPSEWVNERRYRLLKLTNQKEYCNESETLQCLTMITGGCEAEGLYVSTGTTVVLTPGETLQGDLQFAMVAEPKPLF